jgi:hypothetical protein
MEMASSSTVPSSTMLQVQKYYSTLYSRDSVVGRVNTVIGTSNAPKLRRSHCQDSNDNTVVVFSRLYEVGLPLLLVYLQYYSTP